MKACVFIQTNHKQITGAIVAEYALRRYSQNNDKFDVQIMDSRDYPMFAEMEGKDYLRDAVKREWQNNDLQSFTPTRFMPPKLMDYEGRAVVIDPDIFATTDIWELLNRDMQGKAIMCRMRSGPKGLIDKCMASSVMLLDCAQLPTGMPRRNSVACLISPRTTSPGSASRKKTLRHTRISSSRSGMTSTSSPLGTKMLHTTRRKTQPWKTGLPTDWRPAERFRLFPPAAWVMRARRKLFGEYAFLGNYKQHPDHESGAVFLWPA